MKWIFRIAFPGILFALLLTAQEAKLITPQVMDFGTIREGQTIQGTIKLVNVGDSPLKIAEVRPSCGCTVAKLPKKVYMPGDTSKIDFTVKTIGFQGVIHKTINIYLEKGSPRRLRVVARAIVVTGIQIRPRYLRFLKIPADPDTTVVKYLNIENTSDKPLVIKRISSPSEFLQVSPDSLFLTPHQSKRVEVRLRPLKSGRYDSRITIESNYRPRPRIKIPVIIYIQS